MVCSITSKGVRVGEGYRNYVIHHCCAASSDVTGTKTNWGQSGKYLENKIRKSWRVGASHEARHGGKGSWNDYGRLIE